MVKREDLRAAYLSCLKELSRDSLMTSTKCSAGFNEHGDGSKTQVFVEVCVFSEELLNKDVQTGGLGKKDKK